MRSLQAIPTGAAWPRPSRISSRAGIQAALYDRYYAERKTEAGAGRIGVRGVTHGGERGTRALGPGLDYSAIRAERTSFRAQGRPRTRRHARSIYPRRTAGHGGADRIADQHSRASEALDAQPGYYFAFGETLDELADQLSLTRLYFHCPARSAASLVCELTGALNRFQTPFQLKTPAAPALYRRTDAAVLYVGQRYFPIAARIVSQARVKIRLEASTPLFTEALWPGIGAAVEPGSGESFGSHGVVLQPKELWNAWRQGEQGIDARLAAIERRFRDDGLNFERPWVGPTGRDPFELSPTARLP